MSIPSIFAGTCIVFLIVCIIGYHHTNKEKKRQALAAQERAAANRFTFHPQLRNDLINKLKSKNFNPIIVRILETAELGAQFNLANIQQGLNLSYKEIGQITDQLECLGFISTFDNNIRRWLIACHNTQYISQQIEKATSYPI
jgi:predicted transcriptional regulator